MIIKKIIWLDRVAEEALIVINSDYYCEAFCQPCRYQEGDIITDPLLSFEEASIIKTEEPLSIIRDHSHFGHEIVAEVLDGDQNLVKIENIIIELDSSLPKDIKKGERVSFCTPRLDVI